MYPAPIVSKHTFSPGRRRRDTSKCSELSVKDAPICSWLEKFMDLLELQPASPHPFFGMAAKCLFVRGATGLSDQGLGHWWNQTDATCLFSLLLAFWITEFQSEMSGGDPEKLPQTQLLTNLYLVNLLASPTCVGDVLLGEVFLLSSPGTAPEVEEGGWWHGGTDAIMGQGWLVGEHKCQANPSWEAFGTPEVPWQSHGNIHRTKWAWRVACLLRRSQSG